MGIKIKILSILIGFIFLIFVLINLRKKILNPSYSFFWFFLSLFLISIPFLEPMYKWLATEVVGIKDARHIIYIGIIGILLVHVFYLTGKVSILSDRVQELISSLAVIDDEKKDDGKEN